MIKVSLTCTARQCISVTRILKGGATFGQNLFAKNNASSRVPRCHLSCHRFSSSLSSILQQVEKGSISASDAENMIEENKNSDSLASFSNIDHNRGDRTGFPEAVFGEGKTPTQIASILDSMASRAKGYVLTTRISNDIWKNVEKIGIQHGEMTYHETARMIVVKPDTMIEQSRSPEESEHTVVVACAGTTDLFVAEEAALTLQHSSRNIRVERIYDVGVAGLHRIVNALPKLRHPSVRAIVVCAGMDGALPSVVGGLVKVPVVAVPTSVGYGAALGGVGALLSMINSCSPGVGVVNINNGFGGAALAFKIANNNVSD